MLLGVADALGDGILGVDERRHQLGGVDVAAAHLQEVGGAVGEGLGHQCLGVVDAAHGGDGEVAQVGAHDQRLGLVIGDAADAHVALHVVDIPLKLGAEGGVFDVVDGSLEAVLTVDDHAATAGAQVRVVIGAKEQVKHAVVLQRHAKESTHCSRSFDKKNVHSL